MGAVSATFTIWRKMMPKKMPEEVREWFRKHGAEGGKQGAARMTKKARSERAKKAVAAREAKRKETK